MLILTSLSRISMTCIGYQVNNHLENPPINPITGHGRTAADVQRDRERYEHEVREEADITGGDPAIFQADFIFVKLPHKGVQLHRVANGLYIDDAVLHDISFTTAEYTHTPQDGVSGFWGTFEPALNAAFNPADRKSGTKFSRHQNIGRDVIIVYNVQVIQPANAAQAARCLVLISSFRVFLRTDCNGQAELQRQRHPKA